jgi:hypothetical protein
MRPWVQSLAPKSQNKRKQKPSVALLQKNYHVICQFHFRESKELKAGTQIDTCTLLFIAALFMSD